MKPLPSGRLREALTQKQWSNAAGKGAASVVSYNKNRRNTQSDPRPTTVAHGRNCMSDSTGFDHPPVVEAILGVQFPPPAKLTNGHLGWFWKKFLEPEWTDAVDAAALPTQLELFGALAWATPQMLLSVVPGSPAARLQVTNKGGDRMIQIQSSRFHYNWQKKDGAYPSYRGAQKSLIDISTFSVDLYLMRNWEKSSRINGRCLTSTMYLLVTSGACRRNGERFCPP